MQCSVFKFLCTADVSVNVAVEEKELSKGDSWSVHKFGGTCMGSSQRIKNVGDIVLNDDSERKLVVVSAMSKVTDMMYDLINKAQSRDESYISSLDAVLVKHSSTAHDILDGETLAIFLSKLHEDISNLKAMLRAIYIGRRQINSFPLLNSVHFSPKKSFYFSLFYFLFLVLFISFRYPDLHIGFYLTVFISF